MRHLILLLLFCYAHHSAQCQHAVAMPVKMNVLYRGVDNPISIAAENHSCSDLILTAGEDIDILPDLHDSCLFSVYAKTHKSIDTLFIKTKTGQLISARVFRIKSPGDFVPTLDGIVEQGIIKKEELLARKEIKPVRAFSDFDETLMTAQFQAVSCSNGVLKWLDNQGPYLTEATEDLIREANAGDIILFDGIRIYGDNSCNIRISPLKYYLENEPSEKLTFSCAKNQTALYHNYPLGYDDYNFTKYQNICPCSCASKTDSTGPDAKGNILKSYYGGSDSTRLLRTEKLLADSTLVVEEFSNGRLFRQWSMKDKEMVDSYSEFHPSGGIKVQGSYKMETFSDTIMCVSPVTLIEKLTITKRNTSVQFGKWLYYNTEGQITKEEMYVKGQLILHTDIDYFPDGVIAKKSSIKNKMPIGSYEEFHPNGKPKISGHYSFTIIRQDSTAVVDPFTLEKKFLVDPVIGSVKSGTWKYFDLNGTLIKEEKYGKGKAQK